MWPIYAKASELLVILKSGLGIIQDAGSDNKCVGMFSDIISYDYESSTYGGSIYALTTDDSYVYVGGSTPMTVKKLNKIGLDVVAESVAYGGTIRAMAEDDSYIYVGGESTRTVKKLSKTDLTQVAESQALSVDVRAIESDGNYIYAGGGSGSIRIHKFHKSDLSKASESADGAGSVDAITTDDTYVYAGGTTQRVRKYNKDSLVFVAQSADQEGTIIALKADDNYVYVGAADLIKLNKSNLSQEERKNYKGSPRTIEIDSDYLYTMGGSPISVMKISKSDLSIIAVGPPSGGLIYALAVDDGYIYSSWGSTSNQVGKMAILYGLYGYKRL